MYLHHKSQFVGMGEGEKGHMQWNRTNLLAPSSMEVILSVALILL